MDWNMLGIGATTELIDIKRAYARKVKEYHPEDNPEGFQRLREAYEEALKRADSGGSKSKIIILNAVDNQEENSKTSYINRHSSIKDITNNYNTPEQFIFKFMKDMKVVYDNTLHRNNIEEWKKLLEGELLWAIDIKQELYYQVSSFLQDNHEIPYEVILLLNECFRWTDEPDELFDIFLNEEEIIELAKENNHKAIRLRAATILFYRGISLQNIERTERALKYYDEAEEMLGGFRDREVDTLRIKIMFTRANAFCDLGQYEKAIKVYDNLLRKVQENEGAAMSIHRASALLYKGRVLYYLHKHREALSAYWKVVCTYRRFEDSQVKEIVKVAKSEIRKEIRIDVLVIIIFYCILFFINPGVFIYYFPVVMVLLGCIYAMKKL